MDLEDSKTFDPSRIAHDPKVASEATAEDDAARIQQLNFEQPVVIGPLVPVDIEPADDAVDLPPVNVIHKRIQ